MLGFEPACKSLRKQTFVQADEAPFLLHHHPDFRQADLKEAAARRTRSRVAELKVVALS